MVKPAATITLSIRKGNRLKTIEALVAIAGCQVVALRKVSPMLDEALDEGWMPADEIVPDEAAVCAAARRPLLSIEKFQVRPRCRRIVVKAS
jgi:hypothetical protein